MGAVYYALPAIAVALMVACGIALAYRTRRMALAALLLFAMILLGVLVGRLAAG